MHYMSFVTVAHCLQQTLHKLRGISLRVVALGLEFVEEFTAFEIFHDEVDMCGVLIDFEEGQYVWMMNFPQKHDFIHDSLLIHQLALVPTWCR